MPAFVLSTDVIMVKHSTTIVHSSAHKHLTGARGPIQVVDGDIVTSLMAYMANFRELRHSHWAQTKRYAAVSRGRDSVVT